MLFTRPLGGASHLSMILERIGLRGRGMLQSVYEFLQRGVAPRVAVVGDLMLDTYVWGGVGRISPEGPIPVLHVQRREHRPGGAASVATMLAALGARVRPVGLVGTDAAGEELRERLREAGADVAGLVPSGGRPTIAKTRFLGYVQSAGRALQQLLRVDEEMTTPLTAEEDGAVRRACEAALADADVLVLQDHGKGLLGPALVRDLIAGAKKRGLPVIIDPELSDDHAPYRGADCLLPNRYEAQMAAGFELRTDEDCRRAAAELTQRLDLGAIVMKLDRDGICFQKAGGEPVRVPTHARDVADVTGAGDMVTAAVAYALGAGLDLEHAVALANFTAGIEVACHGVTPLPRARVLEALAERIEPATRKVKDRARMRRIREELRAAGLRVAFTNGCFDLLHIGHVRLLNFARAQADVLVVGLNTDASVRALKGPSRPVNSEQVRAGVLASLADVDYVVPFDEESVGPLIEEIRPDVLVKGADYAKSEVIGADLVESYGGRVLLCPLAEGFSTTDIIARIAENHTDEG